MSMCRHHVVRRPSTGDHVTVLEKSSDGWWKGRRERTNDVGWFPSNYVRDDNDQSSDFSDSITYSNPADNDGAERRVGGGDGGMTSASSRLTAVAASSLQQSSASQSSSSSAVIDTVRAVYAFQSSVPEELTFDKDEILYIIAKPETDPDWLRARNSAGACGLIPRNYVKTLSKDSGLPPTPESHSNSSLCGAAGQQPQQPAATTTTTAARARYDISGAFAAKDWYWGDITRADAEQMLNKYAVDGDFLLRASETNVSHCEGSGRKG